MPSGLTLVSFGSLAEWRPTIAPSELWNAMVTDAGGVPASLPALALPKGRLAGSHHVPLTLIVATTPSNGFPAVFTPAASHAEEVVQAIPFNE